MVGRRAILAVLTIIFVSGCGTTRLEEPRGPTVLTYEPTGALPGGLLEGPLVVDGGCVALDSGRGGRFVLILPTSMTVRVSGGLVEISDPGTGVVAATGQRVRAGGGAYGPDEAAFLEEQMGREIPQACRTGRYWLVGELVEAR